MINYIFNIIIYILFAALVTFVPIYRSIITQDNNEKLNSK